jgi:PRTRC genetic system protein A
VNVIDRVLQKEFPVVMTPRHEPVESCGLGKMRLLMGQEGLYLETRQAWGAFTKRVWKSPRILPYGGVEEQDGFVPILTQMIPLIQDEMVPEAAANADRGLEWFGLIVWSEEAGFRYMRVDCGNTETPVSVDYEYSLPKGVHVVADVHSHGKYETYFSEVDDIDEKGARIYIVLGDYDPGKADPFRMRVRYGVYGFMFDLGEII